MNKRLLLLSACLTAAIFLGNAANVDAGVMTYRITVEVTSVEKPNGLFNWNFNSVPAAFVGTFDADDSIAGSISNFDLTIGGTDLAISHSVVYSLFDPGSQALLWQGDTSGSLVLFGSFAGAPTNYVAAIEFDQSGFLDPFYGLNQNWAGTFSISAVPEPGSLAIFGTIGLLACGRRRNS